MSFTRRDFLRGLGSGGAALALAPALGARGLEAARGTGFLGATLAPGATLAQAPGREQVIRLDSNENPNGPGRAALEGVQQALVEANRYPAGFEARLRDALAAAHGIPPEWILLGCGSTEILHMAVRAFTGLGRPLVTAAPTFEEPLVVARAFGSPVIQVPLDGELRLQLGAMAAAGAPSAGLIYCCNPNNPTATVHGAGAIRRFLAAAHAASPGATLLVDEAYHEYVEDPGYGTAISLVKGDSRLLVSRTFSKLFGLAGLRAGYAVAHPDTIAALQPWRLSLSLNVLAGAAALASLGQTAHLVEERRKNREAKGFLRRFFTDLGYRVGPSETNFLMVNIRRDADGFREACLEQGVAVGRPFPPLLERTRISIGTLAEMRQAAAVFRRVLG